MGNTKAKINSPRGLRGERQVSGQVGLRLTRNGKTVLQMPRYNMIRAVMLNHWYHHRAQLTVYLRLLDVPVPAVYGGSADELPFSPPRS